MARTSIIGTGGDYTTLQAWEDSMDATLTDAEIGKVKNQNFSSASNLLTFSGVTTSGTFTITLTTDTGASFIDNAGAASNALFPNASNGAIITLTGSYAIAISVAISNCFIEKLQVNATGAPSQPYAISGDRSNTKIDNCIIRGSTRASQVNDSVCDIWSTVATNCLFIQHGASTGRCITGITSAVVNNCTVIATGGSTGRGIKAAYAGLTVKNTAVFGFTTPCEGTFNAASDYNATDAASIGTGQGTHNLESQTFANQFESTTTDFRLKTGANLIDAGVSGVTTTDIVNQAVSGSVRDIGAWEFQSGGGAAGHPAMRRFGLTQFTPREIGRKGVNVF